MGTETGPGEVIIRRAGKSDVPAVYAVGRACFADAWREETVARDMALPHSLYFIAEAAGRPVGYACYWFVADEAQLINIGVLPEMRRRGAASKLLEAGMTAARHRGMISMFLEVRVSNLSAQALYRRHGFSVLTLRRDVYDLPREDGYIMARSLIRNEDGNENTGF